jgi:hypothetical protein
VYEDGVEQKVIGFKRIEAPITVLLLCEFASTNYNFIYDMRNAAWAFAQQLHPQDYVAMMTFDMRTQIITDFTQDKRQLFEAINMLRIPGFSERNLFDAIYEAEDRLSRIEGCLRPRHLLQDHLRQDSPEGEEHPRHHHLHRLHRRSHARHDRG